MLVMKFPILQSPLTPNKGKNWRAQTRDMLYTCFILHNMCRNLVDFAAEMDSFDPDPDNVSEVNSNGLVNEDDLYVHVDPMQREVMQQTHNELRTINRVFRESVHVNTW